MSPRQFKKLRVIVLMQAELMPPETLDGVEDKRSQPWRTEYDVVSTLRAMGHEAWPIGVGSELGAIRKAIHEAAVYGLQSSRPDSRPRQGSHQEGDGIPSHPRAAFRGFPDET
jgi:hypothetical protein